MVLMATPHLGVESYYPDTPCAVRGCCNTVYDRTFFILLLPAAADTSISPESMHMRQDRTPDRDSAASWTVRASPACDPDEEEQNSSIGRRLP